MGKEIRLSTHHPLLRYILQWADNSLIIGHRLSEWCGHGPVLEQDIAMTNIALDLIGEARNLYQYAAEIEGNKTEDDYPFKRKENEFYNCLLTELPNGHFGDTIVRQFLYDTFHYFLLEELKSSNDERLSLIARKSFKEVSYHLDFSSKWMLRLGDGTEKSHNKIQEALNDKWIYSQEFFMASETDFIMLDENIGVDLSAIQQKVNDYRQKIIKEATLSIPEEQFFQSGGKNGTHTEYLGYILTDMQYYPRTYPNTTW